MTTYRNIFFSMLLIASIVNCSTSVENWNKRIKKDKGKQGWLPILEQFKGKRIAFINIYSTEKIGNGLFVVKILWVNHQSIADGHPEDIFVSIEDCINKRSAIIDSNYSSKDIKLSALNWRKLEGDQLQPVLCENLMKIQTRAYKN